MGIYKTLLYPFSTTTSFFEGYAWAIELALRLNAKLQLFTVIPGSDEASVDKAYQSLLAAHGYYLHHFNHDTSNQSRLIQERFIVRGEIKDGLIMHLKNNPVDIMIIDTVFQSLHRADMKEIVRESNGAIMLSDHMTETESSSSFSNTEYFYNQLLHAEFYKIPENFFSSLQHDHSAFNYLRKFFLKEKK